MSLEFSGERYVPGTEGIEDLYAEHMSRYVTAANFLGGGAVLDLGCGCGYGASYLASRGASYVLGTDISPDAVGFARDHYGAPGLAFAVMDARALAVGGAFQLVTCFEVIEHVDDAPQVLAEAFRVLTDRGILLVSTPNKATYAAGGPAGNNPFHVREYTGTEFEQLLRSVFPHVLLLNQRWCEGLIVDHQEGSPAPSPLQRVLLPGDRGNPGQATAEEAAYFIAACGRTAEIERAAATMPAVLVDAGSARYRTLKRQVRRLQAEFDKRAAWAAKLRDEVEARDGAIRKLHADLGALEKAYDERGKWAQGLTRELQALRAGVRELPAEAEGRDEARLGVKATP